jgi:hypothetical protein
LPIVKKAPAAPAPKSRKSDEPQKKIDEPPQPQERPVAEAEAA